MRIIFCSEPISHARPDTAYVDEAHAARHAGLAYELISFETLVDEADPAAAVRRVTSSSTPELAIYRGWMLRPPTYQQLYDALQARGVLLINTPEDYRHCHYLPESYPVIAGHTPMTVYLPLAEALDMARVKEVLAPFGDQPLIVKDYVKSRKHEWHEACYIPSAADLGAVERVVRRFLELQGDDVEEGLVFREYIAFRPLGQHPKSGMPLTKEFRLFFLDGELLYATEHWEEAIYDEGFPPLELFHDVARRVRSRFFTMDVAQRMDGRWMIVELGDAQVAGLPEHADLEQFYRALSSRELS